MLKHLILFALVASIFSGCRTADARRTDEGNEIARAACDYIVFQHRIPSDLATLRTYAKGQHYAVRWGRFSDCAVHPISTNGVRVEFVEVGGLSDWRVRYISARNLSPFVPGSATNNLNTTNVNDLVKILTDPKAAWMFYH